MNSTQEKPLQNRTIFTIENACRNKTCRAPSGFPITTFGNDEFLEQRALVQKLNDLTQKNPAA